MARRFWPGERAVGRRVSFFAERPQDKDWFTVVGVVGDVKDTPMSLAAPPAFYWSGTQIPWVLRDMYVAVKSTEAPSSLTASIRSEIAQLDPNLPITEVRVLDQIASAAMAGNRLTLLLVGLFAALALLLAAVGIYGVMAYTMQQRVHEVGVRMALGARKNQIAELVVGDAARMAVWGVIIGSASGLVLTRLLTSLLYGIAPNDPLTFAGVAVLSAAVALLASYVPARRSAGIDPMRALRYE
jgi:ABC-type antimicrobial peptide transport system permease subunit